MRGQRQIGTAGVEPVRPVGRIQGSSNLSWIPLGRAAQGKQDSLGAGAQQGLCPAPGPGSCSPLSWAGTPLDPAEALDAALRAPRFCGECLQPCLQVPSPLCPLCRMPFDPKKVEKASNVEKQLSSYKAPCRGCSKKVTLAKMRSHVSSCAKVQEQMANCPKFVPVVPTSQPIPRYCHASGRETCPCLQTSQMLASIFVISPKIQEYISLSHYPGLVSRRHIGTLFPHGICSPGTE
nr:PREDICTED: RING finger protein 166-like [Apteryx mantelli mantelli]